MWFFVPIPRMRRTVHSSCPNRPGPPPRPPRWLANALGRRLGQALFGSGWTAPPAPPRPIPPNRELPKDRPYPWRPW